MRKRFLRLWGKLEYRFCDFYTWLLRSSLKSCGQNVRLHYPVRIENPEAVSLGAGTIIYPRSWINPVSEWAGIKYNSEVRIGNRVMIGYSAQISAAQSIVIEDDVAISSGCVIVDHIHEYRHLDVPVFLAPLSKPLPIRIGKGSFLGVKCMIGPGVQIGEHAVVAANSVVVNDVPAYAIAVGNPARAVRFHNPEAREAAASQLTGADRA